MTNMRRKLAAAIAAAGAATAAPAAVTFYAGPEFHGPAFTADRPIGDLERWGFNDRASSAVVRDGAWEACEDARFGGRCVVLRPGDYPNLGAIGWDRRISSVRPAVRHAAYAAPAAGGPPAPVYDYRRREGERVYEVPVTSVRAVVGPPEQRCWVEQRQIVTGSNPGNVGSVNVPGAIIGGVLGGVLGHQIGGGRGRDVATGLGAVGGAIVGSSVGNQVGGGQTVSTQDVQRCAGVPASAPPAYWDVTYTFRGYPHHVQLAAPPGPTLLVNGDGEPRV